MAQEQAPGWCAELDMVLDRSTHKTVLRSIKHSGPLRVQRPFYPEGGVCHIYILHPPGGVVGGDRLAVRVCCQASAHALLTTPGASKFYRSERDSAQVSQALQVASGASLEWLPQENIFFRGARAQLSTRVDLEGDACFMGWDINCLGRPVIDERFDQGRFDARFGIYRDGVPVIMDRQRVLSEQHLQASAGLRGYPMHAVFFATPCVDAHVDVLRELLLQLRPEFPVGITLVDRVLIVRALGWSTEDLQAVLIPVWQTLRPALLRRQAVLPRIWAT